MASVNKVILIGNLGKDPEMRYIPSGKAITSFSMATSYKKGDEYLSDWHNVECWEDLAERTAQTLKKGSLAYVEGEIRYESWTGEDGTKKYKTKIIARVVRLLEKKEKSNEPDEPEESVQIPMGGITIPIS